ncbi:MAG TPA: AarF/UbiB family protein [Bryobacteraceae bacterium]|nr:AarF/UbiB family protein [Bryobacteraceae bacterium]
MDQLAILAPLLAAGSTTGRIAAAEEALKTFGQSWRDQIGDWVTQLVPVEFLVPEAARRWRPIVRDIFQFVFSRLSDRRLATKLVEQYELPAGTPPETRLLRLISRMPGLQKLGQVLARNRRLDPSLRTALSQLENGMRDVTAEEMRAIIVEQLGERLEALSVEIAPSILSEASVSAVLRFTWKNPGRERERGVFKVIKPHVPECFAEDMTLLQRVGEYLTSADRGYDFAVRDVTDMMAEVRTMLEHELDLPREQATLTAALAMYRSSIGIRVPRLIERLSTAQITAMSEERGVKVTDACRRSPIRRSRIASQLIEALVAAPLFSREDPSMFHADPHAGNLLYDEPNRELVVLDWALAEHLSLELRRHLAMLALMTILRNPDGVGDAVLALSRGAGARRKRERLIRRHVEGLFAGLPKNDSPGILDAMRLLDDIALEGVRFPPALFMFRKVLFTLDGVLHDIVDADVRVDHVIAREFVTRWLASFGFFHTPLKAADFAAVQWNALLYLTPSWMHRSPAPTPSRKPKSPRRGKSLRPALRPQ